MKKILIDLDVLTVAFWNKVDPRRETSLKFLGGVNNEEFTIIIPLLLIESVLKWENKELVNKIRDFYLEYSEKILSDVEIEKSCMERNLNFDELVLDLYEIGVKKEDGALVIVSSLFNIDYLVTFNRKHLKNNKDKINEVLKKNGLKEISIVLPDEV